MGKTYSAEMSTLVKAMCKNGHRIYTRKSSIHVLEMETVAQFTTAPKWKQSNDLQQWNGETSQFLWGNITKQ